MGQLLTSLNLEFGKNDSFEEASFESWLKVAPLWERWLTFEALVIRDIFVTTTGGTVREDPSLSKICDQVRAYFKNRPPEETEDGAKVREIMIGGFEKAISSCPDLAEETKERALRCLKEPSHCFEKLFRRIVGLSPGEKNDNKEV